VTIDHLTAPPPTRGRVFTGRRRVRIGDASPGGRLRFDGLARYLQDVSNDDTRDAGLDDDGWVLRRMAIEVRQFPVLAEEVELRTFCSGVGKRWAERRVAIAGADGAAVDAASLWVHVDLVTGRPTALNSRFFDFYGEAAGGRTVTSRLHHPDPSAAVVVDGRRWPLRFTDFDVVGHMNNAAYWSAVEEELARRRDLRAPLRAELEFRGGIDPGDAVDVVVQDGEGDVRVWLTRSGGTLASAHVWRRA
jgi:acyl-ACP thioesterase